MRSRNLVFLVASTLACANAEAEDQSNAAGQEAVQAFTNPNPASSENEEETAKFAGLNFGVGISSTFDLGSNDRVTEAEVVAGLVRVTNQDNVRARVMLESHYFLTPEINLPFNSIRKGNWGVGPFVALQPGTEDVIEAIGLGIMLGFRRGDSSNSFNLGVGLAYDPNTRTLGTGVADGQPLPIGETEVRFLEQDQVGLLILSSFSF